MSDLLFWQIFGGALNQWNGRGGGSDSRQGTKRGFGF